MFKDLDNPIVIIGMHRSGTSFLTRILHHSGIFMGVNQSGVNEARFFLKKNIKIMEFNGFRYDTPGILSDLHSTPFNYSEFKRYFLGQPLRLDVYNKVIKNKGEWGWKDPRNTYTLPFWLKYFPNMKVIHIYRNGIDVALSFFLRNSKLRKGNSYYSESLNDKVKAIKLWEKYYHQSESYRKDLGNRFLSLKYEKLVLEDEEEIKKLNTFLFKDFSKYITEHTQSHKANRADYNKISTEHKDLFVFASNSLLMKQLGYI
jgi:sulfotransferase family protein